MCFCKRSAELTNDGAERRAPRSVRGLSLIELLVAQTIVAIIAAGMFSMIAGITRNYHDEIGATEAQVRLRESSHVLLRTLQSIGGAEGKAGHLVYRFDGGLSSPDVLTVFRSDHGMCGGSLPVRSRSGVNVFFELEDLDGDGLDECPINILVGCSETELEDRVLLVQGPTRSVTLQATDVEASSCKMTFATGQNAGWVTTYNQHWSASASGVVDVLDEIGGTPVAVVLGSTLSFTVDDRRDVLTRSTNGAPPEDVLDQVYDLQVVVAHDLDGDHQPGADEWDFDGTLAGATPANFFGVRVGIATYGRARAGIEKGLPAVLGNRDHLGAPGGRRYRATHIFAAARNR